MKLKISINGWNANIKYFCLVISYPCAANSLSISSISSTSLAGSSPPSSGVSSAGGSSASPSPSGAASPSSPYVRVGHGVNHKLY